MRSGAERILSPSSSPTARRLVPITTEGRLIIPGAPLSRAKPPDRAAMATAASGVIERCPATSPISRGRQFTDFSIHYP